MKKRPLDSIKICCIMSDEWQENVSWLPQSFEVLREAGANISIISSKKAYRPPWVNEHYPLKARNSLAHLQASKAKFRPMRIIDNILRKVIRRSAREIGLLLSHIPLGQYNNRIQQKYFPDAPSFANERYAFFESIYEGIVASKPDLIWVLKGRYLDIAHKAAEEFNIPIVFEHVDLCYTNSKASAQLRKWMPYEAALAAKTASTIVCAPGYRGYYQKYAGTTPIPRIYVRHLVPDFLIDAPKSPHLPLQYLHFGITHPSRLPGILIQAFSATCEAANLTFQGPNQMISATRLERKIFAQAALGNFPNISTLDSCKRDDILNVVSDYDVGIVLHDTLAEGRIHCLTTKFCTYLAAGLIVLSVDTPGMRAGSKGSDAVIFLKEATETGVVEALSLIASMSEKEIMRRKSLAIELAKSWNWQDKGKGEYLAEFVHAVTADTQHSQP